MTVRRRKLIKFIIYLVALAALISFVRWVVLERSLYNLNLREEVTLKDLPPIEKRTKVLIFAPHEDDETLGCAGLIQQAISADAEVKLVLMTNGEYPELSVILFEETLKTGPEQFIRLGYMRQRETITAMKYLGIPAENITFLGYPNQYLNQMWLPAHWLPNAPVRSRRTRSTRSPYSNSLTRKAVYCGESLLKDVETVLLAYKPDMVVTLDTNDVHVDHWPTGTFTSFALSELAARGEEFAGNCRVYTYLIHRDHWPVPRRYRPLSPLLPPAALVKARQTEWFALPLSILDTIHKHRTTLFYRSQGGNISPLLLSFSRSDEPFGHLPPKGWPGESNVIMKPVSFEPIADLSASARNPQGDINKVWLSKKGSRMQLILDIRKNPGKNITFHAAVHAGGASLADRSIAEYTWRGRKLHGIIMQGGKLVRLPASALSSKVDADRIIFEAPWPVGNNARFFLVRAWSTKGKQLVDQTATVEFKINAEETF
jgi:LmbE family N-acetylglucosaminyl deacetylase